MLVKPKKVLGQHFLKDLGIAQAIADTVDAQPGIPVLEVGPGMGVLTQFLLKKEREVKVVEIDYESVEYLRKEFPQMENSIVEDDFLKMHLDNVFGGRQFVLTQKEVAERIASKPGKKAYGIISVLLQAWYDIEYLFTVDEHVFNPPPKVKSAVIRMKRNSVTELGCDEELFKKVVKATFNQRRKTIRNSIKAVLGKQDYDTSAEIFDKRPEQLSVSDFIMLTNMVEKMID